MSWGVDKRENDRSNLIAEIRYRSNSPQLKARISDVSIGGVFVDTVNALELGAVVQFSFDLPGAVSSDPVKGEGIVTWRQEMVGMGIQFTRMDLEDREKIKAYIEYAEKI